MFVNLTPHPITIYPADTPDRIEPGTVTPTRIVPPSATHPPARLGQTNLETGFSYDGVAIEDVAFGPDAALTPTIPDPVAGTWYIVALVVAIAARDRDDLLVPHAYVRDLDGSIIGSRRLGRPTRVPPAETLPPRPTSTSCCHIGLTPSDQPAHAGSRTRGARHAAVR